LCKALRDDAGVCALSFGGRPDFGDQISKVTIGLGEQVQPSQFRTDGFLKQLRRREVTGLHKFVQVVGEVNLHASHTTKCTSSPVVFKRAPAEETNRELGAGLPILPVILSRPVISPPSETARELLAAAEAILPWMVEIRRDLHQHPELGLEEFRTAARVAERLDELGIEHVDGIGGTGVLGLIPGRPGGPVVALRADLDALPLEDAKDVPYRSTVPGRMHACGHDAHTTILLGAARILMERRGRVGDLGGPVKLLFQPAEETVGGARLLIAAGVLENPAVDMIFGLHVDPGVPVGQIGVRYGQRNASSDNLSIVVHGRSAHGAYPSPGVDAIVTAAQVVSALQTVVSRNVDGRDAAVVTIGTIHGGTQGNIVANRVELVGTVRCLDPKIRELVLRRVREVAEGVAGGFGARAEVSIEPSYDPLVNHDAAVEVVRAAAGDLLGPAAVQVVPRANMGVEDFAFYLTHVPGAFSSLGVRNEERGIVHPVHHERFDIDERALAIGAALQARCALEVLGGA
jgi:amidohydrolase